MKLFLLLCSITILSIPSNAQTIKGRVVDSDGKSLRDVFVTLKGDSSASAYQITGPDGTFSFLKVSSIKKYNLSFSSLGYKKRDTSVFADKHLTLLMSLERDLQKLKEVNVVGKKRILERKVDRLIFNVENNINTAGMDGLDLLAKTPLVRVDGDAINLVGKQELSVMIDGRLSRLSGQALTNLLRSMSGDNISKIEVITNPPAQYDATGNSGMINIITKKSKVPGYVAAISERVNIDKYFTSAPNFNVNYNHGNLRTFGGFGFSNGANGPTSGQIRNYAEQTWDKKDNLKEVSKYVLGNVGFEYLTGKSTTIGASYNASVSHPDMQGRSVTRIKNNLTNAIDSVLFSDFANKKKFLSTTVNAHLLQKLDTLGKEMQLDFDYFSNTSNLDNNSLNFNQFDSGLPTGFPLTNIASFNGLNSKGYTFNAQFDLPYKKYSFTFGGKGSLVKSESDVLFSRNYTDTRPVAMPAANRFDYNENIFALFGSFDGTFGKFKLQIGLRGEATQTKGISDYNYVQNNRSYFNVFPTLYLTYQPAEKDILSINAGRRIGRPYFSSVNPFRIYQDNYNYSEGNPGLNASFTDNFELSNTFNSIFNTTISYGITRGGITSVQLINNGSNIQVSTLGNYLTSKNLLIDNSVSPDLFQWLESTHDLSVYWSSAKSTSPNTPSYNNGWGADFSTTNSVTLNKAKTFKAGLDFAYAFPSTSGLYRFRHYSHLDLTGSTTIMNKALQITLSIRDIFKSKTVSYYTTYNDIGYVSYANNDSRRLVLNVKYSFGNNKLSRGRSHSASGDEQSRSGH